MKLSGDLLHLRKIDMSNIQSEMTGTFRIKIQFFFFGETWRWTKPSGLLLSENGHHYPWIRAWVHASMNIFMKSEVLVLKLFFFTESSRILAISRKQQSMKITQGFLVY